MNKPGHAGVRPLARHSLRWRLPVVISSVIAIVMAIFLWVAYRTVEVTFARRGGERAQTAVDQVAASLDARRTADEVRRLADDPDVRECLTARNASVCEAGAIRVSAIPLGRPRRVEVWDLAGSRLAES